MSSFLSLSLSLSLSLLELSTIRQMGIFLNTKHVLRLKQTGHPSSKRVHCSARTAYELASKEVLFALALLIRASLDLGRRCPGRNSCRRPKERAGIARRRAGRLESHQFGPLSIQLRLRQDIDTSPYSLLETLRSIILLLPQFPLSPETLP
jgi:hypothetical protein